MSVSPTKNLRYLTSDFLLVMAVTTVMTFLMIFGKIQEIARSKWHAIGVTRAEAQKSYKNRIKRLKALLGVSR